MITGTIVLVLRLVLLVALLIGIVFPLARLIAGTGTLRRPRLRVMRNPFARRR